MLQYAFATALLTYIWNIQRMLVTEEEMAVYTGTLLLCPHRAGLTATDRIGGLQHALNDALQNNVRAICILLPLGVLCISHNPANQSSYGDAAMSLGVIEHGIIQAMQSGKSLEKHRIRLQIPEPNINHT